MYVYMYSHEMHVYVYAYTYTHTHIHTLTYLNPRHQWLFRRIKQARKIKKDKMYAKCICKRTLNIFIHCVCIYIYIHSLTNPNPRHQWLFRSTRPRQSRGPHQKPTYTGFSREGAHPGVELSNAPVCV